MLDVGNNLDEALALQAQHTELMQKLQVSNPPRGVLGY